MKKHLRSVLLAVMLMAAVSAGAQKYAGGDISLLPSYEANGAKYYDNNGAAVSDVAAWLHDQGWNAVRLRLFVDPENASADARGQGVRQSLDYIRPLAKRIKNLGMAWVLDLHYSDTWADPSNQWTPKRWHGLADNVLADSIYAYTAGVLQTLKADGCAPDMIQTGNEISYGMDWGTSSSDAKYCYPSSSKANWDRFALLLGKAVQACRDVCPQAKVIVHTERVSVTQQNDNRQYAALTGFYDKMKSYGIDYDVIGLSYYPYFHGAMYELEGAIERLGSYGKDIMIMETGYPAQWAVGGTTYDYTRTFPYTEDGQKAYTDSLVNMLNKHSNVKGLFWWFPEANEFGLDWNTKRVTDQWYNATLFNNQNGRAFKAVGSLKNFLQTSTGIKAVGTGAATSAGGAAWYTLSGRKMKSKPVEKGIYVNGKKKVAVE